MVLPESPHAHTLTWSLPLPAPDELEAAVCSKGPQASGPHSLPLSSSLLQNGSCEAPCSRVCTTLSQTHGLALVLPLPAPTQPASCPALTLLFLLVLRRAGWRGWLLRTLGLQLQWLEPCSLRTIQSTRLWGPGAPTQLNVVQGFPPPP